LHVARTRPESRDVMPSNARLEGEPDGDQCSKIDAVEMCRIASNVRHMPRTRRSARDTVPLYSGKRGSMKGGWHDV
jgi:hypothetical protein